MLVRDWAVMVIVNNLVAPNTIELSATRINVMGLVEKRVVHRSDCRAVQVAKLFPCYGYQADPLRSRPVTVSRLVQRRISRSRFTSHCEFQYLNANISKGVSEREFCIYSRFIF
jgi:hypothetical protein